MEYGRSAAHQGVQERDSGCQGDASPRSRLPIQSSQVPTQVRRLGPSRQRLDLSSVTETTDGASARRLPQELRSGVEEVGCHLVSPIRITRGESSLDEGPEQREKRHHRQGVNRHVGESATPLRQSTFCHSPRLVRTSCTALPPGSAPCATRAGSDPQGRPGRPDGRRVLLL